MMNDKGEPIPYDVLRQLCTTLYALSGIYERAGLDKESKEALTNGAMFDREARKERFAFDGITSRKR